MTLCDGPRQEHCCEPPRSGAWNDGVLWACDGCQRVFRGFFDYGWQWLAMDGDEGDAWL